MKSSINLKVFISALAVLICPVELLGYNYLYIHPTTGAPIHWEEGTTVQYWLDPGSFGSLANEQAHTLLQEAMKIWEGASEYSDVPHFEFGGYLEEDVTGDNYEDYVTLFPCYEEEIDSCPTQAQKDLKTVIVFDDEDNSILDNELCRITSCSASAGARVFSGNSQDPENIVQGIFVVGSGVANRQVSDIVAVMVHELGHLLGLAHTSVNEQVEFGGSPEQSLMPTMFSRPFGTIEQSKAVLNSDDIAGISALYPGDDFTANTATIKGQILKSDLTPMMHVNVIARNVEDPLCEAYSWLSARECDAAFTSTCEAALVESPGSVANTGFSISALPPGTYTVEVEEVADESLAMTLAPGLVDPFIYGDAEFWNEGEQADESYLLSSTITLAAGETREGIDIILNRSEVTEDRIKYIPLDTFTAGPGTRCPEEPPVDYAEMIGVEEAGGSDSDGETAEGSTSASTGGCSLIMENEL